MAMEMAMMGLLGTVVGASAMGIGGIAKSIAEAYVPGVAAAKDRRQQMNVDLQARRYEAVRVWRSGLCSASNAYRQWEAGSRDTHCAQRRRRRVVRRFAAAPAHHWGGSEVPYRLRSPLR